MAYYSPFFSLGSINLYLFILSLILAAASSKSWVEGHELNLPLSYMIYKSICDPLNTMSSPGCFNKEGNF